MLTQPEKEYVKRLLQAQPSLTNEDLDTLIEKRRENESQGKSNRAPQKGILGAMEGFNKFMNTNPVASTARDVGAGAIQAGGEVSAGLLGQLSRLAPGNQSADQSSFYNKTQKLLGDTKKDMQSEGINTEGPAYGFGKGVMNIAAGTVGAGFIGKGISAAAKTKMLSNLGIKVAQASPTTAKYGSNIVQGLAGGANKGNLVQRTLGGIATGAREGLGFDLASGNAPGAGTIAGAITGGASPIIGAGFQKVKNLLTSTLPKSLIARGMTTPSALKNASERLSKLSDDGIIDIEKAPEWMLQKGLGGSKKEIQAQLSNIIKESGKSKVALLSSNKQGLGNVPQVKSLQNAMKDVLKKYAKVGKKSVTPTPGNEELVKVIQSFINNKNPTAIEVEKARSLLGNMQIFTKLGDFADSASKEGLQKVWVNVSKYLDDAFPGFRATNKDIEVAMALSKAIGLKEAQDSTRHLLTFTNLGMGGLGATYGYTQGGGEGAIAGLLLATGGKALLNNPAVTTRVAQSLASPTFQKGLTEGAKVIGKTGKKVIPAITSKKYE